jgi:hypothetical protein
VTRRHPVCIPIMQGYTLAQCLPSCDGCDVGL